MARLSVLDQSPVRSGASPVDAIRETLALARRCDELGYTRYWLAEHHSTPALAGSAPEVLIGQVAAVTSGIRVGSGGVMLQHYSALKVAENFRVLETLYPGRIDLAIGRAPGSDQLTARALGGSGTPEFFPQQVQDLVAFLHGELPAEHPFAKVRAMPTGPSAPPLWLLGSSDQSAALAAHFGLAFSFAHFINAAGGVDEVRERERGAEVRGERRRLVARAEQPELWRRRARRHRAHRGERVLGRQLAVHEGDEVLHLFGKKLGHAGAAERPGRELVAARRTADAEVDAAGIERLQHAKALGHLQRAV